MAESELPEIYMSDGIPSPMNPKRSRVAVLVSEPGSSMTMVLLRNNGLMLLMMTRTHLKLPLLVSRPGRNVVSRIGSRDLVKSQVPSRIRQQAVVKALRSPNQHRRRHELARVGKAISARLKTPTMNLLRSESAVEQQLVVPRQ